VRWEGYPDIEDHTWEPRHNLSSCPQLIAEFERKLSEKRQREEEKSGEGRREEQKKESIR
jgi:hypothetical protein